MKFNMGNAKELLLDDLELLLREISDFSRASANARDEIPKILENYILYVAKTGNTVYPWQHIRTLFRCKLQSAIATFSEEPMAMERTVFDRFDLFRAAPFTIQRLSELIIDPKRHYKLKEKYLFALEKAVYVVSTVEPISLNDGEVETNGIADNSVSANEVSFNQLNSALNITACDTPSVLVVDDLDITISNTAEAIGANTAPSVLEALSSIHEDTRNEVKKVVPDVVVAEMTVTGCEFPQKGATVVLTTTIETNISTVEDGKVKAEFDINDQEEKKLLVEPNSNSDMLGDVNKEVSKVEVEADVMVEIVDKTKEKNRAVGVGDEDEIISTTVEFTNTVEVANKEDAKTEGILSVEAEITTVAAPGAVSKPPSLDDSGNVDDKMDFEPSNTTDTNFSNI